MLFNKLIIVIKQRKGRNVYSIYSLLALYNKENLYLIILSDYPLYLYTKNVADLNSQKNRIKEAIVCTIRNSQKD